jgi:multicomponent Na+:H+ antiporter subunit D
MIMLKTGLAQGAVLAVAVVVIYSLLTFIPLMRIWSHAFWRPAPATAGSVDLELGAGRIERKLLTAPAAGLVVVILLIGLMPEPLLQIAEGAAAGILDPDAYVQAVLGTPGDDVASLLEAAK